MIRLILVLIFVYALYNFVFKVIVPLAARSAVNKAQRDIEEHIRKMNERHNKPEGEIHITKKNNRRDDGEYVDYEEVK